MRKAEGWIKKQEISQAGIHQLMRAMGMHRSPTQAEWELFSGWLSMGFTVDGMIRALERLTGSYSPTFKRLGEVLSQLAAQGMFSEGGDQAGQPPGGTDAVWGWSHDGGPGGGESLPHRGNSGTRIRNF